MMLLLAAKTLSRVEVNSTSSHQHEFHAGKLRRVLGFGTEPVKGELVILFYLRDDEDPELVEDRFTLYDARVAQTGRGPEWRLYYESGKIQELAEEGDLLVIYRPSAHENRLHALVARRGTQFEQRLRHALDLGDFGAITLFIPPGPQPPREEDANQLALAIIAPADVDEAEILRKHPLYLAAVQSREVPRTREMARAALEIVIARNGEKVDPDVYLTHALEEESALFFAIERVIGNMELKELVESGAQVDEVLTFAMSKLQSRRSRRGQSLQNHVEILLNRAGIPNTPQCETEKGEKPDFIIPSCRAYHDPAYPDERLRMVGCKSKLRDRWRQYLNEAQRVNPKFHVSVDDALSDDVIERMNDSGLRMFMPAEAIEKHYSGSRFRSLIGTIGDLLEELRRVL
jgi:hypothetical protein